MKKFLAIFAAVTLAVQMFASNICSLRAVPSQYDTQLCFEIVPTFDWSQINSNSLELLFVVYFYDEWMNPLTSPDEIYRAADGQVAANVPYQLTSDDSNPVINVCIPVEQLHLKANREKVYYTVEVFIVNKGDYQSAATSSPQLFEVRSNDVKMVEAIDTAAQTGEIVVQNSRPVELISGEADNVGAGVDDISSVTREFKEVVKAQSVETTVSETFSRTYRNDWDDDMCEEMRFYANGSVELVRVFKGDATIVKSGTYVLSKKDGTRRINIRIGWNNGGSESTWYLSGASKTATLYNGKQEWKFVK